MSLTRPPDTSLSHKQLTDDTRSDDIVLFVSSAAFLQDTTITSARRPISAPSTRTAGRAVKRVACGSATKLE